MALFYKGLHGLSAIPCDSLRRPVTPNTLTLTHLLGLYFLLVLLVISTRSSLEPFQNGISYRRMFDPNHLLFLSVLPSQKLLDHSKIISEPCHSSSNGRMSIAGYLPKNQSRMKTDTTNKITMTEWLRCSYKLQQQAVPVYTQIYRILIPHDVEYYNY